MRKAKRFYAARGYLTAEGATKTEAKAKLEIMVDWACSRASMTIESRFGLVLMISANASGFDYAVFNPADLEHGKQRHCSCSCGQIAYTDILLSARSHAAQVAWTHDIADDSAFVAMAGLNDDKGRELASWIAFQRKYRAAKNAGHNDAAAFDIAQGWRSAALPQHIGAVCRSNSRDTGQ